MSASHYTALPPGEGRRRIVGLILIYFGGLVLLAAGVTKFAHLPPVVAQLTAAGFGGQKILLVAGLELLSAALFLLPKTRSIGLLLTSAFLGAAVAAHVQTSEYAGVLAPAILLCICWFGAWLRYPAVLWSFNPDATVRK
jgi:DoxX-like family